jgi:hypothetical protein
VYSLVGGAKAPPFSLAFCFHAGSVKDQPAFSPGFGRLTKLFR